MILVILSDNEILIILNNESSGIISIINGNDNDNDNINEEINDNENDGNIISNYYWCNNNNENYY